MISLKYLDPDYSSKNHVRKFLRALPLKWRAKVTAIKDAKDLATLHLDELIGNLKVYETILGVYGVASKPIKDKVMPIAFKANITNGQTSSDSICQDKSDEDKEINLMAKNFRKLFQKGIKKHDKFDIYKEKTKGGTRHLSEELGAIVKLRTNLKMTQHVLWLSTLKSYSEVVNSGCTNDIDVNKRLLYSYSFNHDEHIIPKSGVFNLGKKVHASHKLINMISTTRVLELLHMELFGPSSIQSYGGTSSLVDDDMIEEHAIQNHNRTQNLNCDLEEVLPRVENIKEIRDHHIDQVIGELDERTLRSDAQYRSNLFAFVSTIEPKNIKEAIKDES
ncbi:hypothetical protein Tco_1383636 [Tanacetum coccineum]